MGEPQISTIQLAHGEGLSEITFSNAWNALGETWSVLGIVPGWARGRVFVCPTCLAPAVATDVYKGGRGDVPCVECVAGHIIERNGSEVTAILAIVKQVINVSCIPSIVSLIIRNSKRFACEKYLKCCSHV